MDKELYQSIQQQYQENNPEVFEKQKQLEELKQKIDSEVFAEFLGMDEEYRLLVSKHHDVAQQRDKYAPQFIQEHLTKTKEEIAALKSKYGEKAMNKLAALEDKYTVKKEPKPEPTGTQEKLLYQIERMNNMKIFEMKLATADLSTLTELYDSHKDDEDFLVMLDVHANKMPETDKIRLEHHIKQSKENPFLDEIKRMKYAIKTLSNPEADSYAALADNGLGKQKFRSVARDLTNIDAYREGWK